MLKKIDNTIKSLDKIVVEKWGYDIIPKFNIDFSLSSTSKLGCIVFKQNGLNYNIPTMKLNKDLLEEFKELYINNVIIHEYAHLVVNNLFPSRYNGNKKVMPHGKEFKAICSHFGIDGKSTTSIFQDSEILKKNKRKVKRYSYKCDCSIHEVTIHKYKKIQSGTKYICKKCKGVLKK